MHTDRKTYRLPPKFWEDHRARDCSPSATVERETKTYVMVSLDTAAYHDLLSDCDYYIDAGAAGAFDLDDMRGLVASAKATMRRLLADPLNGAQRGQWTFVHPNPNMRPNSVTVHALTEHDARLKAGSKIYGADKWNLKEDS